MPDRRKRRSPFGSLPFRATPCGVFDADGNPVARMVVRPEAERCAVLFEQAPELLRLIQHFDKTLEQCEIDEKDPDRRWIRRVLKRIEHGSAHN